ncbi:major facilitator superfamily MFS_1 [Serinicoccus hydrothermalis]|uniref:Major facilitator superfamily MFS_1 n=1 Tax=Serinicoccus hydrothermalis TaxID=1758689 RepID=A0A1B1NDP6_9MICO|nr:major facilitator superfamily MFS_1 [Serinicoccus hydrothermalis]
MMAVASAVTTLGAIPPFLLGAQAVEIREDLDFGLGAFGVAVSLFFATAALATLSTSSVVDRLSRGLLLLLAGALVTGGGLAMTLLASGRWSLMAVMVVLGLGNAACQATANSLMARTLPPDRRGLGFGVKQSAVPLAIMLGGLAVPTTGAIWGWRSTFVITTCLGVLVMLGATGLLLRGRRRGRRPASTTAADLLESPPTLPLLLAAIAITLASAAANYVGSFAASWGFEVGLSPSQTGILMALGSGGSIALRVFSGWRADHRHGANLPVVAAMMWVGTLGCLGLMVPSPWAFWVFGLLAFSIGWSWPGLLLYAVARLGRDNPAQASAAIQAGAFAGGALGPALLGGLSGAAGFPLTWAVAAGCFAIAGALILLSRRLFTADLLARPPREPFTYGRSKVTPPREV